MARAPYITQEGYQTFCNELSYLLREKRPTLTRAVSEAAALGDRSENAEYIYGKKLLRETDRRIRFLQKRLPDLQVIERLPDNPERIFFGAFIELEDEQGELLKIRIVGSDEFLPEKHWISIESPLARALLGKQIDDEIIVNLPNNNRTTYVVTHIKYKI